MHEPATPHNVSRTRTLIGESKKRNDLPWERAEEVLEFHATNDPTRIYQIVLEYHADTGYWVLYEEWRYKNDFGDEVVQLRTREHVYLEHEAHKAREEKRNKDKANGEKVAEL